MLKDLQEYAAKIRAEVDKYDPTAVIDPDLSARAYVFAYEKFTDVEKAERYLLGQIAFGGEKVKKWKMQIMKKKARLIVQAASDGLSLLHRPADQGGGNI